MTIDPTEQLCLVLDMSTSSKIKVKVGERVQAGLCLGETEEGEPCECQARTRGLCEKCHYRWRQRRIRMSVTKAAVYDAKLIRAGKLLSPNGAKEYKSKSVFDTAAKEAS